MVAVAVILIVEDDLFIRELSEMTIQEWGYHTFSASDAGEALSLLRSPQQIDVLFTDIYLKKGVMSGCELAEQAIRIRPNLHVLYTTGNSLTAELKALFVEGSSCLVKPYTPKQLQASLEGVLAAQSLSHIAIC
jgi:CheY-like chemotaxis protein